MARLRAGDDAGLSALMERYSEPLFHFFIRCLGDETEAEDLAQETFVRVYQHRAAFDPQWKFSTWMFSIAMNLVKDRRRWQARHPAAVAQEPLAHMDEAHLTAETQPSPADGAEAGEQAAAVRRAIAALPEELRAPLLLAGYEGQSCAQIARILGCPPKTVESRLAKARQLLRKSLKSMIGAS